MKWRKKKKGDFIGANKWTIWQIKLHRQQLKALAEEDMYTIAEDEGGGKWCEEPAG